MNLPAAATTVPLDRVRSASTLGLMNEPPPAPKGDSNLAKKYPTLSPDELEQASENLREYVALALRVFERLELDPEASAQFEALTASRRAHRMNDERAQTN